jgi:hypothetical protein
VSADFRKTAEATVVAAVSGLLKSYQEEVDRLTQRAKAGESAFLDVYQRLYEAPDPATALMDGLVRLPIDQGSHSAFHSYTNAFQSIIDLTAPVIRTPAPFIRILTPV